jgi:hypothetical protein
MINLHTMFRSILLLFLIAFATSDNRGQTPAPSLAQLQRAFAMRYLEDWHFTWQ